jgi:hypothetical protein
MGFSAEMDAFIAKVRARGDGLFINTASHVHTSVVSGSPVTGAPGQPVDTGNLRTSWQLVFNGTSAEVSTNVEYAQIIEDNERGAQLRSAVGGFHSVKMTRAGWDAIVIHEAKKLGAG